MVPEDSDSSHESSDEDINISSSDEEFSVIMKVAISTSLWLSMDNLVILAYLSTTWFFSPQDLKPNIFCSHLFSFKDGILNFFVSVY